MARDPLHSVVSEDPELRALRGSLFKLASASVYADSRLAAIPPPAALPSTRSVLTGAAGSPIVGLCVLLMPALVAPELRLRPSFSRTPNSLERSRLPARSKPLTDKPRRKISRMAAAGLGMRLGKRKLH